MRLSSLLFPLSAMISGMIFAAPQIPARTLTFEDAARINLQEAAEICFAPVASNDEIIEGFRAAGFIETVRNNPRNTGKTYTFSAPSETVVAEVYSGDRPDRCAVATRAVGVQEASAILDALVPGFYPEFIRKLTRGGLSVVTGEQISCVNFEDPDNPIGRYFSTRSALTDACVDDGTSILFSAYRS
ncbi:hypothetical protein [Dinoroseobacter sp. S375]|uniref:hypothetical protein n=1 Tax=Dinoroseobacter sp. S375 TaxID=3415136 RepID=UPI003C7E1876